MTQIRKMSVIFGPVLGWLLYFFLSSSIPYESAATAGITLWVALWWIIEPIPIPATSIIPFFAFPFAGIITNKEVTTSYGHWLILLLLSGFLLSLGMEKSGVHRRIANGIIRLLGGNQPKRIILGVMLACGLLSAWISNTATCLMMLPIALALSHSWSSQNSRQLLLSLAYSASIGGMATPIGTPPNVVLMGVYEESTNKTIGFMDWMLLGVPISLLLLLLAWLYLTYRLKPEPKGATEDLTLPPISTHEKRMLLVFFCTALAWMLRKQPFGGWSGMLEISTIGDDTVGLIAAVSLFLIPTGTNKDALLVWKDTQKLPWGLLLLFGGGIAIAKAFGSSGLSQVIGSQLSTISSLPMVLMIATVCLLVTFLTEITSNTATTTLLMPILAATAIATETDPRLLMIPAALSASCAFMLPVATAPNAIVFGTNKITATEMARTGFGLNLIGIVIITIMCSILL